MRVISGSLKGRIIPFDNRKFGNADATPQKVKEALFSILGENLEGCSFLDLFGCSGQIGLEAVSRGCAPVVFNERDHRRYGFIKRIVHEWGLDGSSMVLNMQAYVCLKYLSSRNSVFDFIFLDPPYIKERGDAYIYREILDEIGRFSLLKEGAAIIVQHFARNTPAEEIGAFYMSDHRIYGTSALSFYREKDIH